MIKFFRKIRQQLLNKNKFSKYLLYAIGEIILVMIGIILALQVNKWNDQRKQNIEEIRILYALKSEFEEAKLQLNFKKELLTNVIQVCYELLEICESEDKIFDDFTLDSLISLSYYRFTFEPPNGIIHELFSSGKISFVSNDELRNLLSGWGARMEDLKNQELNQQQFVFNEYWTFLDNKINVPYGKHDRLDLLISPSKFDSSILLSDLTYSNLLKRSLQWYIHTEIKYSNLEAQIDRIIELAKN